MTCSHAFLAKVERLCIPVFRHPRPHIVHEQTGGVGKCLLVLDTDADGAVEVQGRMTDLDGRGAVAHHQLRQQADAQPLRHHGEDGPILPGDVLHVGADAHLVKGRHDLVVVALLQLDEGFLRQRRHGEYTSGAAPQNQTHRESRCSPGVTRCSGNQRRQPKQSPKP